MAPPIDKPNQKSINKMVQEKESTELSLTEHRATQWQTPAMSRNTVNGWRVWRADVEWPQNIVQINLFYVHAKQSEDKFDLYKELVRET